THYSYLLFFLLSVPLYRRGNKSSYSIFLLCASRKSSSPRSIASCHSRGRLFHFLFCVCQNSSLFTATSSIARAKPVFMDSSFRKMSLLIPHYRPVDYPKRYWGRPRP